MAKFCPDCGTAATGGKFCAECGFRFPDATAQAAPALAASTDSRWQNNNSFNGSFVGNTNGASAVPAWQQKQPSPAQFAQAAQVATAVAPMAASAAGYAANNNGSFIGNNTNGANATPAWQKQPSAAQFGQAAQVATAAAPMAAAYAANNNGSFIGNNTNGANATPAWQKQPSTTQFGQAAQGYSTPNAGTYGRSQPSPPMAVAMPATGGATAYGNGANGMASSDSNTSEPYKPPYMNATPPPPPPPEPVPPAASGAEAQQVYEQCVQTMRQSRGGNNENGVKTFKQNCRLYGLKQMDVEAFYDSLVQELGPDATLVFVPNLARLVPDDDRRKELVEYNATKRPPVNAPYANWGNRSSSSSVGSFRERSGSQPGAAAPASKGILKGRYADHPNCDICNVAFDVTKRRHHCRQCGLSVCNSCSPLRLLIPDGMQVAGAKGYDPSIPQRVCIQCAPGLHQYQDQLVAQHAQANEDNAYTAQGRLVHVPFSNSLFKECQNAADIIGNFFRDDWGAAADRSIPVAFLQKAHGLAVLSIIKAGFLITGQIGTGLVVAKLPDGSWSAPSAIGLGGLGGGFEIGGEMVELMIILGSQGAVKVFHKPQANIGAGLDLAVGPYGRSAVAAAAVSTSGLNANYSYSHSKGFFAGISLQGKIIAPRNDLNRKFYGRDLQPGEILSGHIAAPNAARPLYEAIEHAMQGIDQHRDSVSRRSSLMGPCRMCNCPMFVAHTKQVWNKNCKTCKHVH